MRAVFTHKDHTAYHREWHAALGAPRLLHAGDVVAEDGGWYPYTADFEIKLSGTKTQHLDPYVPRRLLLSSLSVCDE